VRGKFVSRAFFAPRGAWVVVEHFVVGISRCGMVYGIVEGIELGLVFSLERKGGRDGF